MATVTLVDHGSTNADTNAYPTNSISFVSGRVYVIGVEIGRTGAATENPVISGTASGTWTNIGPSQFNSTGTPRSRVQVKYFKAASTFSEVINITTTNSHNGCRWAVVEINGYDSGATFPVQNATNQGDAITSLTLALAAFAQSSNIALGFFGASIGGNPFTAGGSFTLLNQDSGTAPAESLGVVYFVGDADPVVTFASASAGGVAIEVPVLATSSGGLPLHFFTRDV